MGPRTAFGHGLRAAAAGLLAAAAAAVAAQSTPPGDAIGEALRRWATMGTVLHVAAHPDDENTRLIAYLALARRYRTGYLSITRGDGGQNAIGPELDETLGVIRTQELLAGRRLDGGRQFFTRAIDFGYSKTPEETLRIWDREQVLGDVVRVIRTFRPDVIITRFSPNSGGETHGHHTASAILAVEAFRLAGDPNAYPEQLRGPGALTPWQPKRVLLNGGFGRRGGGGPAVQVEVGGADPVSGVPLAEIASRSRGMHRTQGIGLGGRGGGVRRGGGPAIESFTLLAGDPPAQDIMDGVETTWRRVAGGEPIARQIEAVIRAFDPARPAASVAALLEIQRELDNLPPAAAADPIVVERRAELDRIIADCLGLVVRADAERDRVRPGETLRVRATAWVGGDRPLALQAIRTIPPASDAPSAPRQLAPGSTQTLTLTIPVPSDMPLTQPYWLREDPAPGIFRVADPALIGLAEDPPAFRVEWDFELDGRRLRLTTEPQAPRPEPVEAEAPPARVRVIAPVWLEVASPVVLAPPGQRRTVVVRAEALTAPAEAVVRLSAPPGWRVEPSERPIRVARPGPEGRVEARFEVSAPPEPSRGWIDATANVGGRTYGVALRSVRYPHVGELMLQPPARARAVGLALDVPVRRVGYVAGAGDATADALAAMGCDVVALEPADLVAERLQGLDALVFGIRVFDTRREVIERLPAVFEFARQGGTVLFQYNRQDGLLETPLTLRISNSRITDEDAPLTLLAPDHPALRRPHAIAAEDFAGWVQERAVYVPREWDAAFVPLLAGADAGEAPLQGLLLAARYGRGHVVYTSLALFRQLPAGVPGAYRLLANLLALGRTDAAGE